MNKLVIANWKMNGTVQSLAAMMESLRGTDLSHATVVLCPPFTMLGAASVSPVAFGAQDVSMHYAGPYTGEISAEMVAETGSKYAIVGHSDHRLRHGDTNEIVALKSTAASRAGLIPVICVGASGDDFAAVETELRASIPKSFLEYPTSFVIAWEPIGAISTGPEPKIPSMADIEKMHLHIYKVLRDMRIAAPIIYGGSVSGSNASDILALKHVDGVLVGGASLKPETFIPIIKSV